MVSSVFAQQLTVPAIFDLSHIAPPPPSPPPTYFIGKVLRDETTEKTRSFTSTINTYHISFPLVISESYTNGLFQESYDILTRSIYNTLCTSVMGLRIDSQKYKLVFYQSNLDTLTTSSHINIFH